MCKLQPKKFLIISPWCQCLKAFFIVDQGGLARAYVLGEPFLRALIFVSTQEDFSPPTFFWSTLIFARKVGAYPGLPKILVCAGKKTFEGETR
jgi:hypothetical protein